MKLHPVNFEQSLDNGRVRLEFLGSFFCPLKREEPVPAGPSNILSLDDAGSFFRTTNVDTRIAHRSERDYATLERLR